MMKIILIPLIIVLMFVMSSCGGDDKVDAGDSDNSGRSWNSEIRNP